MKSFITSIIIAVIIVSGSIFYTCYISSLSEEFSKHTQDVYELIEQNRYREASKLTDELIKFMDSKKVLLAATGNHEEIDKIELYLDELSEFIGNTTQPDALARCKSLRTLFDNLPKNYRIRAENIL